jgi:hypothetical protein
MARRLAALVLLIVLFAVAGFIDIFIGKATAAPPNFIVQLPEGTMGADSVSIYYSETPVRIVIRGGLLCDSFEG